MFFALKQTEAFLLLRVIDKPNPLDEFHVYSVQLPLLSEYSRLIGEMPPFLLSLIAVGVSFCNVNLSGYASTGGV